MEASNKRVSLRELVAQFGGEVIGDDHVTISRIAPLTQALPGELSFLANSKYRGQLQATRAAAVIVGPADREATPLPRIVADNPYAYFAHVLAWLHPPAPVVPGIHPSAVVGTGCRISGTASVGAYTVIGDGVQIGDGASIGAHCTLGDGVSIGAGSRLHPQVSVYAGCRLGERVIVHSGAVIGADGFGIAWERDHWFKIPQVGAVVIGNDVEIGANTTIDRGALSDTVIEDDVKLDNQIQVAHNVFIGAHTAVAGCVGIAGSTRIGRNCMIGGAAMIIGHLEICDGVQVSAGTFISKSIRQPGIYTSTMPFTGHDAWLKNAVHLRRLDEMHHRIKELEAKLGELERKQK